MQLCSSSIAQLAGALAQAQRELDNPPKALTAVLEGGRSGRGRTYRYAPLSAGLDIVRETLGKHELAVIRTTHVDQDSATVLLTTTLAHGSGEWVAATWPVCRLADLSQPKLMGAALTYARRYGLFTLVGLAGEDDLDAPELASLGSKDNPSALLEAADTPAPANGHAVVSGPVLTTRSRGVGRPAKGMLPAEDSAALRDRLLAELHGLASSEDLTVWAHRSLPDKNTLTAEDARALEHAFEARAGALETLYPGPPHPKSPRDQRSDEAGGRSLLSQTSPSGDGADVTLRSAMPKPRRKRDKDHLAFVAAQPCLLCGRQPCDAHHLRFAQPRALGRKVSDEFTVPLCRVHHRELHDRGDEQAWWEANKIDPTKIAQRLWSETR